MNYRTVDIVEGQGLAWSLKTMTTELALGSISEQRSVSTLLVQYF
ncbi:hypothetical protein PL9631_710045 [Planktothrix paucivesiculata PCC 9631]|uniref:Uncharacterized protein n=1 Tax=Planktothrix paucivesiculata PCC 9631 TaxID=671071 RepID=A0A7Z9E287_9CYAN|nr:hypothetical protein PL9631_710045 [Planktothrix paucivesiculata PCC 9631]